MTMQKIILGFRRNVTKGILEEISRGRDCLEVAASDIIGQDMDLCICERESTEASAEEVGKVVSTAETSLNQLIPSNATGKHLFPFKKVKFNSHKGEIRLKT